MKVKLLLNFGLGISVIGIGLLVALEAIAAPTEAPSESTPTLPTPEAPAETPSEPTPDAPASGIPGVLLEVEGELEQGDQILSADNSLYDEHTFEGQGGQPIMVNLQSPEFDTYLVIVSPEGRVIAENDDISPENLNSSITVILPSNGTYRAIANAYDAQGRGEYSLTITTPASPTNP